jgi:hypothetical protein
MNEGRFFGKWSIETQIISAKYNTRFTISGSGSSDGSYVVNGPFTLPNVTGASWMLSIDYYLPTREPGPFPGESWLPAQLSRATDFTVANGLVVSLSVHVIY